MLTVTQIAMPISFGTGFGLHWDLYGLWAVSLENATLARYAMLKPILISTGTCACFRYRCRCRGLVHL